LWSRDNDADIAALRAWLGSAVVYNRILAFAHQHPTCKTAADAIIALATLHTNKPSPSRHSRGGYRTVMPRTELQLRLRWVTGKHEGGGAEFK
jgi:hypothetical protein